MINSTSKTMSDFEMWQFLKIYTFHIGGKNMKTGVQRRNFLNTEDTLGSTTNLKIFKILRNGVVSIFKNCFFLLNLHCLSSSKHSSRQGGNSAFVGVLLWTVREATETEEKRESKKEDKTCVYECKSTVFGNSGVFFKFLKEFAQEL